VFLKEIQVEGVDWNLSGPEQGPDCCEHGSGSLGSITCRELEV
jgi:hypothetical protein